MANYVQELVFPVPYFKTSSAVAFSIVSGSNCICKKLYILFSPLGLSGIQVVIAELLNFPFIIDELLL